MEYIIEKQIARRIAKSILEDIAAYSDANNERFKNFINDMEDSTYEVNSN